MHAARDLDARILALSGTSAATTLFLLAAAPVFAAIALTQDALIISLRDASLAFVSGGIALGIGLLMLVSKQDPDPAPSSRVAAIPLD